MKTERRRKFVINAFYFFVLAAIVYVIFRYAMSLFAPFIFAAFVVVLLKPVIGFCTSKLRIKRRIAALAVVFLFYAVLGGICAFAIARSYISLKGLFTELPQLYTSNVKPVLDGLFDDIELWIQKLDPSLSSIVNTAFTKVTDSIGSVVTNYSVKAVGALSGIAAKIPAILVGIIFTIVASFFFAGDYYRVTGFVMRQLPEKARNILITAKNYTFGIIGKYIRSYTLIMVITFFELSAGFWVISKITGLANPFLLALIIAVFDLLPVVGVGTVLIPWSLIEFVTGDYIMGICTILLYLFVLVLRHIMEPKIIGRQVGLHPLVTLVAMYVGSKLFGVLGLFGLPISISLLNYLNDDGSIKIFK